MPHRRWTAALSAAACLPLLLAGCVGAGLPSSGSGAAPKGTVHPGSLVGVWTLAEKFGTSEQPFIAFVQDNTWSASDGCNRVRGTWKVASDGALTTTSGPSTLMSCEGAQLPLTLAQATHVKVAGDKITIMSLRNATATTLVRTTDRTVGPQGRPIGYWTETRTSSSPYFNFSTDGTYSGSDGCNRLFGTWASTPDEAVTLSHGAITLTHCDGVDDWLNRAALGRVKAGLMTLQDAGGNVLGQLRSM